jgi:hypothetical protein
MTEQTVSEMFADEDRPAIEVHTNGSVRQYRGKRTIRAVHHRLARLKRYGEVWPIILIYVGRSKFGEVYIDVVSHQKWYRKTGIGVTTKNGVPACQCLANSAGG